MFAMPQMPVGVVPLRKGDLVLSSQTKLVVCFGQARLWCTPAGCSVTQGQGDARDDEQSLNCRDVASWQLPQISGLRKCL